MEPGQARDGQGQGTEVASSSLDIDPGATTSPVQWFLPGVSCVTSPVLCFPEDLCVCVGGGGFCAALGPT